jgi:hypothetical protein
LPKQQPNLKDADGAADESQHERISREIMRVFRKLLRGGGSIPFCGKLIAAAIWRCALLPQWPGEKNSHEQRRRYDCGSGRSSDHVLPEAVHCVVAVSLELCSTSQLRQAERPVG